MTKARSKLAEKLMNRFLKFAIKAVKPVIILGFEFLARSLFGKSINDKAFEVEPEVAS